MKLPELEKSLFVIKIDSVELTLNEPALYQIEKLASYQNIDTDDPKLIDKLADIVASLMGSYEGTLEEKKDFVKNMSLRQINLIIEGLKSSVSSKKAEAESETSNS